MTQNFKKLAIAASVSSALSMMSMPSHAVIQGSAGEALLVPLVVYATPDVSGYEANTIIQVSIPGSIGFDDVPNIFVAPNTTPTNPGATPEAGPTLFPNDPDLGKTDVAKIHWYWFDERSMHRLDKPLPVTANDVVVIDWRAQAQTSGSRYDGQAGYMVIGTEIARRGEPANFTMFGDAWLEIDAFGLGYSTLASIPVLPMSDGQDGMYGVDANGQKNIGPADNVVYKGGIPAQVSPMISGMRTNRSDGIPDITVFDLPLFSRVMPSMHVVWLDRNLDSTVAVDVYDSEEVACSATVSIPNELNVIWIDPVEPNTGIPQEWWDIYFAHHREPLCLPDTSNGGSSVARPNFVSYYLPEYVDTNADRPESAGVAFTLSWTLNVDARDNSTVRYFEQTMLLGHERGTYRQ
ncbi:hypothetical protein GWK36_12145 [Caldichromatium japonicum]|uniref:Uncharacterized protein n=2 Tax=Caldichromatium japonicum TaxID=2699430 RepID=A0A6G7VFI3_9GAMM|nr:hypothetical protein GWK36_12145 [Caldichromatium japonicum]